MIYNNRSMHGSLLVIFLCLVCLESKAGDSVGVSMVSVIRLQMQSIADEVVSKANFDSTSRVSLIVKGEEQQELMENAFIEAFQKNKFPSVVKTKNSADQALHVLLLRSECIIRKYDTTNYERKIRTVLEAQTVKGKEQEVRLLGSFARETIDTAMTYPSVQVSVMPSAEEGGVLQQLLTPLIMVAGSILIVYLLFTVRS